MSKVRTILQAGKQIAASAGGRAIKGKSLKTHPEDSLNDPAAEIQGSQATSADKERAADPGNPNEIDGRGQQARGEG